MFQRLAVLGVGAIGSVIGGYLTRAGRDVTLIDTWPDHVETMKRDGLRVTALDDDFTVPVKAMHIGEVSSTSEPFDAAFLSVKSYDTVWAAHFIMPYLGPTGIIVSAQNAVNDEVIAPIAGYNRVLGCVITLGAGHVRTRPRPTHQYAGPPLLHPGRAQRHGYREGQGPGGDHERRRSEQGHQEPVGRAVGEASHQLHGQSGLLDNGHRLGGGQADSRRGGHLGEGGEGGGAGRKLPGSGG